MKSFDLVRSFIKLIEVKEVHFLKVASPSSLRFSSSIDVKDSTEKNAIIQLVQRLVLSKDFLTTYHFSHSTKHLLNCFFLKLQLLSLMIEKKLHDFHYLCNHFLIGVEIGNS